MFHMAYILQINGEVSPHVRKHANYILNLGKYSCMVLFLNCVGMGRGFKHDSLYGSCVVLLVVNFFSMEEHSKK